MSGLSAIHAAVEANDPTAVRAALAEGADVNELGGSGEPPLMEAARAQKLRAGAALNNGERDTLEVVHEELEHEDELLH